MLFVPITEKPKQILRYAQDDSVGRGRMNQREACLLLARRAGVL
jgi:hypothetical protein